MDADGKPLEKCIFAATSNERWEFTVMHNNCRRRFSIVERELNREINGIIASRE